MTREDESGRRKQVIRKLTHHNSLCTVLKGVITRSHYLEARKPLIADGGCFVYSGKIASLVSYSDIFFFFMVFEIALKLLILDKTEKSVSCGSWV